MMVDRVLDAVPHQRGPVIREDKDLEKLHSLRERSWELFGHGFYYAWFLCAVMGSNLYGFIGDGARIQTIRCSFIFGITCGYLIWAIVGHFRPTTRISKRLVVIGGVLSSAGTALAIVPIEGYSAIPILLLSTVAIGFGIATQMIAGAQFWANSRPSRGMIQLVISGVFAFIVFYLLACLPPIIATPAVCLLPLGCATTLVLSKGGARRAGSYRKAEAQQLVSMNFRMPAYIFCLALVSGVMLGFIATPDTVEFKGASMLMMVGVTVALVANFVLALRCSLVTMLEFIDSLAVPLMVCGLALLMVLDEGTVWIGIAIAMAGYTFLDQFSWMLYSDISFRNSTGSMVVVPRCRFIQHLGNFLGFCLGCGGYGYFFSPIHLPFSYVIVGAIVLITVARAFIEPREESLHLIEVRTGFGGEETLHGHCAIVAERYALSTRESEVLFLLARGRSGPYIQDELCISQGTVKSHMRSIYKKLGISSKQELLNIIEQEE